MTLLSICIPTYNRGPIVVTLVKSLLHMMPKRLLGRVEIVISENHSTDDSASLLKREFSDRREIRICRPAQHFGTAEENLCFAVSQCQGEFVWTLGDDDSVEIDSFETLLQKLEVNEHDFLLFNSRSISYDGILKQQAQVKCNAPELDIPMLDFIRLSGFWFIIAGFSMSVFRRSCADNALFQNILSNGRIYAHVVWLIACFHDKRFCFVNQPLVAYRENSYVTVKTDHWESVSLREKTFEGGLWSTGFLRLIDILVERGVIDRRFISEVVDQSPNNRFYFADELLSHYLRGLQADIKGNGIPVPEADIRYFNEWALALWGNNIVLLSILDKTLELRRAGQKIDSQHEHALRRILDGRRTKHWFENFHKFDAYGFGIFRHGCRWFAIRNGWLSIAQPLLETIDFEEYEDMIGVADTETNILLWVKSQPRKMSGQKTVPVEHLPRLGYDSHSIAAAIRTTQNWKPRDWYRMVRAINHVAKRGLKRRLGLRG